LYFLRSHSTTWAIPPALFVLVIFEIGACFLPRLVWTAVMLYMLLHTWNDRQELPCCAIGWHGGPHKLFVQADLEPQSSWSLSPPDSCDYKCEPLAPSSIKYFYIESFSLPKHNFCFPFFLGICFLSLKVVLSIQHYFKLKKIL
jgi:hypothetical protein